MGNLRMGARQAVRKCLKIKEGEKVVIITDQETQKIGLAIAREIPRGADIQFFVMEDFGPRPLAFPRQIGEALARADVAFFAAQDVKGELQTFRGPMLDIRNAKSRFAHMGGITEQIMEEGMCADYDRIAALSKRVYQKVRSARKIEVRTPGGTNLVVQLSPLLKWIICDGLIASGYWTNLPDGEVFTCPVDASGILVVDGCLGDFFDKKYGPLEQTPVSIFIENGRAMPGTVKCANEALAKELSEYLFRGDEHSNRVGEFALGTNIGLERIIGNLLQDEKFPGVHIAFGGSFPEETGADWDSDSHVDCVIQKPTVWVDGGIIMREGKYILQRGA